MTPITTKYLTKNPYFNDGKWITGSNFKGFMLHSVGCAQPNPDVFYNNWNNYNFTYAGISGFIGSDKIYVTAPCLEIPGKVKRMPHGGKAASNNGYIGFEMCEPGTIQYTTGANFIIKDKAAAVSYVKQTYNNAVYLFAELCKFHDKNPLASGVIISHKEGGKMGIASGHVDPEHLWKGLGLSYTMNGFRQDVYNLMHNVSAELYRVRKTWEDSKSQIGAYESLESAKDLANKNPGYKVFDNKGIMVYAGIDEEDEDMTQEKFNEMMASYRKTLQDNDSGNWSKEARDWAISSGMIAGTGNTINGEPNYAWADFLTREQAATLFYRFAKMMGQV